jgi:hypothetical protein
MIIMTARMRSRIPARSFCLSFFLSDFIVSCRINFDAAISALQHEWPAFQLPTALTAGDPQIAERILPKRGSFDSESQFERFLAFLPLIYESFQAELDRLPRLNRNQLRYTFVSRPSEAIKNGDS